MFWRAFMQSWNPTFMPVRVILATDRKMDENTGIFSCEVKHIRRIDLQTNWTVVETHVDGGTGITTTKGNWPQVARAAVSVGELYYCSNHMFNVTFGTVPISEINMDDTGIEHTVVVVMDQRTQIMPQS